MQGIGMSKFRGNYREWKKASTKDFLSTKKHTEQSIKDYKLCDIKEKDRSKV